jgi:hypothetical protein
VAGRARRWVVPLALALLTWQALALEPSGADGLDSSWQAALQMASHYGVAFGPHFAFTFGPLGFLDVPTLWYDTTGTVAFLFAAAVRVALCAALYAGARRTFGPLLAALLTFLVASASPTSIAADPTSLETVVFLIAAVFVVDRMEDGRRLRLAIAVAGAFAGLELLAKLSAGIELTGLALVMALAARGDRRRHLAVFAGSLAVALLAGWELSGQSLGALPEYLRNSEQIVSGYSAAMATDQAGLGWEYAAAWAALALGLAAAIQMGAGPQARRRYGLVALWIVFWFLEFKEGFVRHDADHAPIFFVAVMGGFLAFAWRRRAVALALLAALFVIALSAIPVSLGGILRPGPDLVAAADELADVLSPARSAALTAAGRAEVRTVYPLEAAMLALLRSQTVDVEPYEADVAWAYDLRWRPLPVFQSYTAYTSALDALNAGALASAGAPARILRNLEPGIDYRYQPFDDPETTRAILCRYVQLEASATWQVLGRAADRCSKPRLIERLHAGWNQPVAVPAPPTPSGLVFVAIEGVQVGGLDSVAAVFQKPAQRIIELDGSPYRLIEGTAGDGLLLRTSPGVDYPSPWNLAPQARTIAVTEGAARPAGGRPITFSFYSERVR